MGPPEHNWFIAVQGKAEKEVPLAKWDLEYRPNPPKDHPVVPKGKDLDSHMFGPEWLLSETPGGRYRDRPPGEDDD
jgi:hypothetical protein